MTHRYPGTRPFTDDERDRRLFFGREAEINDLTNLLFSTDLLVLYGRSGLGKTSLLHSGVFPRLRGRSLLPIEVRINLPDCDPHVLFESAIHAACSKQGIEYTLGEGESLWELFKTTTFWRSGTMQTPVLVLDQFEELFTLHSEQSRAKLVEELGELLGPGLPAHIRARRLSGEALPYSSNPPLVKIIVSLREEHLGELELLSEALPRILDQRFRLGPMTREMARRAIVEPAAITDTEVSTPAFEYAPQALEDILDYLAGSSGTIEPFTLQLLCSHIEQKVIAPRARHESRYLVTSPDLGGVHGMDKLVEHFYLDTLGSLHATAQSRRARRMCSDGLLSPDGRRLSIEGSLLRSKYKVSDSTLEALVDARILRRQSRLESYYYELSHDSLVRSALNTRRWHVPPWVKIAIPVLTILTVVTSVFLVKTTQLNLDLERAQGSIDDKRKALDLLNEDLDAQEATLREVNEQLETQQAALIEAQQKSALAEASRNKILDALEGRKERSYNVLAFVAGAIHRGPVDADLLALAKRVSDELIDAGEAEWFQPLDFAYLAAAREIRGHLRMREGQKLEAKAEYQRAMHTMEIAVNDDPDNLAFRIRCIEITQRVAELTKPGQQAEIAKAINEHARRLFGEQREDALWLVERHFALTTLDEVPRDELEWIQRGLELRSWQLAGSLAAERGASDKAMIYFEQAQKIANELAKAESKLMGSPTEALTDIQQRLEDQLGELSGQDGGATG